jgi:antitoxin (DNA-binding transcriptional repressor) of toxin-antitoxin stability system
MPVVDILEAQSDLLRLVNAVKSGAEKEIVIARNGEPVALLVPIEAPSAGQRIGVAKGKFNVPDNIDGDNALIAELFLGLEE